MLESAKTSTVFGQVTRVPRILTRTWGIEREMNCIILIFLEKHDILSGTKGSTHLASRSMWSPNSKNLEPNQYSHNTDLYVSKVQPRLVVEFITRIIFIRLNQDWSRFDISTNCSHLEVRPDVDPKREQCQR